jgi:hypothetical protein
MAHVKVCSELIAQLVFGYADNLVRITSLAGYDQDTGVLTFNIEGPDVPDAREVDCIITVQQNRAGDRLRHQTFPVKS